MRQNYIFWFGAGVSAASGMPLGGALTKQWLKHHLPVSEYEYIIKFYEENSAIFGRPFPRLEKVIDDAISVFGSSCLENLRFFDRCPSNSTHISIANYIYNNKLLAFTTNFDCAVERGVKEGIKVYAGEALEKNDAKIIKLHGSIDGDIDSLGHCIKNLQNGIPSDVEKIIYNALNNPLNTVVFCGYSGADFFDIVPLFEKFKRECGPLKARALWIHHDNHRREVFRSIEAVNNKLSSGALTMLSCFDNDGVECWVGETDALLSEIIPVSNAATTYDSDWDENWSNNYNPSEGLKKIYAAKLYSSFGMGARALMLLSDYADVFENDEYCYLLLNSLRDFGCYKSEIYLIKELKSIILKEKSLLYYYRKLSVSYRLQGHSGSLYCKIIATIMYIIAVFFVKHSSGCNDDKVWFLVEAALFAQTVMNKLNRYNIVFVYLFAFVVRRALVMLNDMANAGVDIKDPHIISPIARIIHMNNACLKGRFGFGFFRYLPNASKNLSLSGVNVFLAVENYKETDSLLGMVNSLRNMGDSIMSDDDGDLSAAEDYYRRSLDGAKKIGDITGKIKAIGGLLSISVKKNDVWNSHCLAVEFSKLKEAHNKIQKTMYGVVKMLDLKFIKRYDA